MNFIQLNTNKIDNNDNCEIKNYPKKFEWLFQLLKKHNVWGKLIFIIIGIVSTVWFLVRVIPKPQRAAYPCMKVAAPIMSSFVLWLLSVTTTVFAFKKARIYFNKSEYVLAIILLLISFTGIIALSYFNSSNSFANTKLLTADFEPNNPIGIAQGLNPGRVAWVWNPNATNENMKNQPFDYWYQKGNANKDTISLMLENGVKYLAGKSNINDAWNSLFTWFNIKQGNGDHGYQAGEKIAIKLNLTNSTHPASYGNVYGDTETPRFMDNTPELVYALLNQLISVYGVNQNDIYIGDNFRAFRNIYWNLCHTDFPDVHYIDDRGTDGREQTQLTSQPIFHFSDGSYNLRIPQHFVDATYIINLAALKSHNSGGITLSAKNNQGSIIEENAEYKERFNVGAYAHASLPDASSGYKKYRHLVDYTGHKDMGGKTVLNIVDGIWGGREFWGVIQKWDMAPFSGDYPSSIFLSQDPVAIDAVCYDFLLEEANVQVVKNGQFDPDVDEIKDENNRPTVGDWSLALMQYADDYLLQEASSTNWPDGFVYDPEGDGTAIESLGVYEHWNNATDKQYSRNLETGDGIELVKSLYIETAIKNKEFTENKAITLYPNPVKDITSIKINNKWRGDILIKVVDLSGRIVYKEHMVKNSDIITVALDMNGFKSGTYIVNASITGKFISKRVVKQ